MKVLTANRLGDGEAVWWSSEAGWVETLREAEVARDADAEARLEAFGAQGLRDNRVVDVNLIDVALEGETIVPVRLRERIRANGPTTHPALGKQGRSAAPLQG